MKKYYKSYDLFLHWKQGDDFHQCIESTNTVSEAFIRWAKSFKENQYTCEHLAKVFNKINVGVTADTHVISFEPKDKKAEEVLDMLVAEKVLSKWEDEDYYDECDDPNCKECNEID